MKFNYANSVCCVLLFLTSCLFNGQAFGASYYPNGFFASGGVVGTAMVISGITISPTSGSGSTVKRDSLNDHGAGIEIGAGYHFQRIPVAFYLEATKRANTKDKITGGIQGTTVEDLILRVENMSAMANLIYDIHIGNDYFIPFVIAGAGFSQTTGRVKATTQLSPTSVSKSKTLRGFAWQAGGGIHIKLTDKFLVNLFYRHVELGKVQWGPWQNPNASYAARTLKSSEFYSNEAILSFTYFFGSQEQLKSPSLIND